MWNQFPTKIKELSKENQGKNKKHKKGVGGRKF